MSDELGAYDAAFDAAQSRNDNERHSSSTNHSDEIEMLMRALRGDLSAYSPAGIQTMRLRLQALHEAMLKRKAA